MPFDLRIPAWVPQSAVISWTATMYGVMATAAVGWAHGGGKQHTAVSKYVPFIVKRHRMPTAVEPSVNIPPREYWREAYSTQLDKVVSFCLGVPEWVDVHGETLVCRFRMRIRGLGSKNEVTEVADTDDPAATLIAALQSGTNAVQGATRLGASSGSGSTKDSKYLTFLRDICIEVEETVKCQ